MLSATHAPTGRRSSMASIAIALLIYAVCVGASMLPTRSVPTRAACLASAGIAGLGSLAMALVLNRPSSEFRRASLIAAALLAVLMLLTPFVATSPTAWRDHVRPLLWLVPWFPLATAAPGRAGAQADCAGACSPAQANRAWLLVLPALILGGILLAVSR